MCIGNLFSKPKTPTISTPPAPSPTPVITPSEVSPQEQAESRRKRLERLRFGLASTIKSKPQGLQGALNAPSSGATTLGA